MKCTKNSDRLCPDRKRSQGSSFRPHGADVAQKGENLTQVENYALPRRTEPNGFQSASWLHWELQHYRLVNASC